MTNKLGLLRNLMHDEGQSDLNMSAAEQIALFRKRLYLRLCAYCGTGNNIVLSLNYGDARYLCLECEQKQYTTLLTIKR